MRGFTLWVGLGTMVALAMGGLPAGASHSTDCWATPSHSCTFSCDFNQTVYLNVTGAAGDGGSMDCGTASATCVILPGYDGCANSGTNYSTGTTLGRCRATGSANALAHCDPYEP